MRHCIPEGRCVSSPHRAGLGFSMLAGSFLFVLTCVAPANFAAAQEVTLRAATPWPRNFFISQSFQRYVTILNERGKGVVQINYIGGPEAIPAAEQPNAIRAGVIDVYYGSIAYTLGDMPEADALAGATRTPAEARAVGAYEVFDEIVQRKLNVKFLAQVDSGWAFTIFLTREPKLSANGGLDLKGFRLRSHPLYRDFLSALDAENIMLPATDLFAAFERNMVQGLAFSEIGMRDFGIERFIKYRVTPKFYTSDIVMLVNLPKWKTLAAPAQKVLLDSAIDHEKTSREYFLLEVKKEEAKLDALGIKEIRLEGRGADDYLAKALSVPWSRMALRADKADVERLRSKFVK